MRELASGLSARLNGPPQFAIVTNGSLLKGDRIQWILDNRVSVNLSWDGDGQSLRSGDPLQDPGVLAGMRRIYEHQPDLMSFNPVMTRLNKNHRECAEKLENILGFRLPIAEGPPVSIYDDGSLDAVIPPEDMPEYGRALHRDLLTGAVLYPGARNFVSMFIWSLAHKGKDLPTACFVAESSVFTVDTEGNLLTCQSYGKGDVDEHGDSMFLGNLADLEAGALSPAPPLNGLKKRQKEKCRDCVVLQICKGGCPYSPEKYFEANCWYRYHHYMAFLGLALHMLTGDVLTEVVPVGAEEIVGN
jgi:radical SAM protein with 4Fe4S-binding SPASM domain